MVDNLSVEAGQHDALTEFERSLFGRAVTVTLCIVGAVILVGFVLVFAR